MNTQTGNLPIPRSYVRNGEGGWMQVFGCTRDSHGQGRYHYHTRPERKGATVPREAVVTIYTYEQARKVGIETW